MLGLISCAMTRRVHRLLGALLVLLLAGLGHPGFADQKDPRLDDLFKALKASHSPIRARRIETAIWHVWTQHANPQIAGAMTRGMNLMESGQLAAAETLFTALIDRDPQFAEAWNKRATIRFYRGNDVGARQDIAMVMRLEPRHFGALSGLGMIHMRAGDDAAALNAYQAARRVNPHLENIDGLIQQLTAKLRGRAI
jgi:Flp pilus assembly protein TadD